MVHIIFECAGLQLTGNILVPVHGLSLDGRIPLMQQSTVTTEHHTPFIASLVCVYHGQGG